MLFDQYVCKFMEQTRALHQLLDRKISTRCAAIMTHWEQKSEIHFAEVKGKLKVFEPDMKEYQG